MRRALVVGIDKYAHVRSLSGCENDAVALDDMLSRNGDGAPNFSVRRLTSDSTTVSSEALSDALEELFADDAETVLFYFAGHGVLNEITNSGYIVAQDGKKGSYGVSLAEILEMANRAYPRVQSTVLILDSCNSGFAGEVSGLGTTGLASVGTGVTILTSCSREGTAAEANGHGLFTTLLLDGLGGASADILGRITPAALYAHIDQTLGPWEQRPIYKANVRNFVTLRFVTPRIAPDVLRRLPVYFRKSSDSFQLDPSFEPDRENVPAELRSVQRSEANERVFRELQLCNRHGLVVPVDAEHMYYAAIRSKSCRLTALGAHYRRLAELHRL